MDCNLPGSSIHGIFQAKILERVAISFSRRSSQPRDWTHVSLLVGRHFTIWTTREVSQHKSHLKTRLELTIERSYQTHSHNIYFKITRLVRRFLLKRRNMSLSNIHCCYIILQFSSVQLLSVSNSLRPHELQHARPPCPLPTPGVYSKASLVAQLVKNLPVMGET